MKIFLFLIVSVCCFSCYAQQYTSSVSDSNRKAIIKTLLDNKSKAEFPFLYKKLNETTRVIRVFFAHIEYSENASFSTDFVKDLKMQNSTNNYWIYNQSSTGYEVLGNYNKEEDSTQMFLETGYESKYLNSIMDKVANLEEISFLRLNGVPGYCVLYKSKIWIIKGNEWTDLNTYLKSSYTLDQLRNIVLLKSYHEKR